MSRTRRGTLPVDRPYNVFDVGSPIREQYINRVLKISSYWGPNGAPYAGYHALGILGPPDCENNLVSSECKADSAWIGRPDLFPLVGAHVKVQGHVAYVRAVHTSNSTLDVEIIQYHLQEAGSGSRATSTSSQG